MVKNMQKSYKREAILSPEELLERDIKKKKDAAIMLAASKARADMVMSVLERILQSDPLEQEIKTDFNGNYVRQQQAIKSAESKRMWAILTTVVLFALPGAMPAAFIAGGLTVAAHVLVNAAKRKKESLYSAMIDNLIDQGKKKDSPRDVVVAMGDAYAKGDWDYVYRLTQSDKLRDSDRRAFIAENSKINAEFDKIFEQIVPDTVVEDVPDTVVASSPINKGIKGKTPDSPLAQQAGVAPIGHKPVASNNGNTALTESKIGVGDEDTAVKLVKPVRVSSGQPFKPRGPGAGL